MSDDIQISGESGPGDQSEGERRMPLGLVFPWLEGADDLAFDIDVPPGGTLDEFTKARVANVAVESRSSWGLGDLFPSVPGATSRREYSSSVRLVNVLDRERLDTFADLAERSLVEVMALRNMGAKSVNELLTSLVELGLTHALTEPRADIGAAGELGSGMAAAGSSTRRRTRRASEVPGALSVTDRLRDDLEILSQWNVARGQSSSPLLGNPFDTAGAPTFVSDAADRVFHLTSTDWLGADAHFDSLGDLLSEEVLALGEREQDIVVLRLASLDRLSLDALGDRMGVTRERVRQIEAKLKLRIQAWIAPDTLLGMRAAALRQRADPVAHVDDVLTDIPSAAGSVISSDVPAWLFLDLLDDGFESDGDWLAVPSWQAVVEEVKVRFDQLAGPHGSAPDDLLLDSLTEWSGLSEKRVGELLRDLEYLPVRGGWVHLERRSLPNFVAAYLERRQEACSLDELDAAVPYEHSTVSLRNALAVDERLIRVGRENWELTSWGGEAYAGIKDAIARALDSADGVVAIQTLVDDLAPRFNVAETSVRAYAAAYPFTLAQGLVRYATERKVRPKSPGQTRRLYLGDGDGEVRFRLTVTKDHLRGSGSPVQSGVAAALHVQPGTKSGFSGPAGSITLSWVNPQPQLSSIRSILIAIDAALGNEIMLAWSAGVVTAWVVDESPPEALQQASALMGIRSVRGDIARDRTAIARAIDLDETATWSQIRERLDARGEADLTELLDALT
ncbi:hypothetical protein B7R21_04785 [Subtercola boreus]|uniref:RNA polymerase sigma-70 region 4 domain-containing protein n=1 Tax=Subtercola boreus TaxID=120213 RepID=A0A3E0VZ15_9MICO|nr:sigma factor-like helix-turn-helix DNA-binding protein [Subtercola boreus]RFA15334.1 hypothetical protein B7R21_04785 [Subtercola boreus]